MALIAFVILVAGWCTAIVASKAHQKKRVLAAVSNQKLVRVAALHSSSTLASTTSKLTFAEQWVTFPCHYVLERGELFDRLQPFMTNFHGKLLILHGTTWTIEATKSYLANAIGLGYLAVTISSLLAIASGEQAMFYVGLLVGIAIPLGKWQEVGRTVERRKQDILLLLPDVLSKLMLLLGAGETVQRALSRCVDQHGASVDHPLLAELRRANEGIRNGESFAAAMEGFGRRCAVQEVSLFTTTLLLNYRRGGDRLVLSLKGLTYTLWEKRKAVARSRGEEASSKLVFPLVGIFLVLMVLVATPAMLLTAW